MIDARAEDPVAAQAVDVLATEQAVQQRAVARPFERRELARLRDGLAIRDEAAIDVLLVGIDRLFDEILLLLIGHRPPADQVEIAAAEFEGFGWRKSHLIGAPGLSSEGWRCSMVSPRVLARRQQGIGHILQSGTASAVGCRGIRGVSVHCIGPPVGGHTYQFIGSFGRMTLQGLAAAGSIAARDAGLLLVPAPACPDRPAARQRGRIRSRVGSSKPRCARPGGSPARRWSASGSVQRSWETRCRRTRTGWGCRAPGPNGW